MEFIPRSILFFSVKEILLTKPQHTQQNCPFNISWLFVLNKWRSLREENSAERKAPEIAFPFKPESDRSLSRLEMPALLLEDAKVVSSIKEEFKRSTKFFNVL